MRLEPPAPAAPEGVPAAANSGLRVTRGLPALGDRELVRKHLGAGDDFEPSERGQASDRGSHLVAGFGAGQPSPRVEAELQRRGVSLVHSLLRADPWLQPGGGGRGVAVAARINNHASLIYAIGDLLRGDCKPAEYHEVVLPFVLLRGLGGVLEPTAAHALERVARANVRLREESLEHSANLPAPEVIAAEIVEDLQAALDRFAQIAADLGTHGRRG